MLDLGRLEHLSEEEEGTLKQSLGKRPKAEGNSNFSVRIGSQQAKSKRSLYVWVLVFTFPSLFVGV